jgi:hypothetical protein
MGRGPLRNTAEALESSLQNPTEYSMVKKGRINILEAF